MTPTPRPQPSEPITKCPNCGAGLVAVKDNCAVYACLSAYPVDGRGESNTTECRLRETVLRMSNENMRLRLVLTDAEAEVTRLTAELSALRQQYELERKSQRTLNAAANKKKGASKP